MKKLSAAIICIILLLSCSGNDSDIVISISVDRPELKKVKVVLGGTDIRTVELDQSGNGTLVLSDCGNVYPEIFYISHYPVCKAFLKKGDKVSLGIDAMESRMPQLGTWRKGFFFSDRGIQEAAEYLTNVKLPKMPEAAGMDPGDYAHVIDSMITKATDRLEERYELAHAEYFKKVERKRIAYHYYRQLLDWPAGHGSAAETDSAPDETLLELIRRHYIADTELLQCTEYTDYMLRASEILGDKDFRSIPDSRLKKRLETIRELP